MFHNRKGHQYSGGSDCIKTREALAMPETLVVAGDSISSR